MLDLYLFPLNLVGGQEQTHLPGLLATNPPRRADRHRAGELLILLLTLSGPAAASSAALQDLPLQIASRYYRTRGSATAALRATIEQFNEQLFNRNLRAGGDEGQLAASLSLAVLRKDRLFLAQAGNVHALVLTPAEVQDFHDAEIAGRGLGLSRSPGMRFFQTQIQPGDLLLLSPSPLESWTPAALAGGPQLTLNQLRRRLLNQAGSELQAAVIQFQSGAGQIHFLKPKALPETPPTAGVGAPAAPEAAPSQSPAFTPPVYPESEPAGSAPPLQPEALATAEEVKADFAPSGTWQENRAEESAPPAKDLPPAGGIYLTGERYIPEAKVSPAPAPAAAARQAAPGRAARPAAAPRPPSQWRKRLAELWLGSRAASQKVGQSSKSFLGNLLPGAEASPTFSPSTMLFIALAVPILVVVIAMTVYVNTGRSAQHQVYLEQAKVYAAQAASQTDADLQRNTWSQALYWLEKAEEYGQSEESAALRNQAQQVLDSMDGILRLAFQPTLPSGLGGAIEISQIAANNTEAYLLDKSKGRVLRLFLTGQGYQLDTNFQCEPGPLGGVYISPLVDIATLPPNNDFKAAVVALDTTGNLLYCGGGITPTATALAPPDSGWGQIASFTIDQGILYVLDTGNNAVWLYPGANYHFAESPRLFFDNEVPVLSDVADLAVNGEDLYLLHQDGKMTLCVFRAFSLGQTKCTDPAPYGDSRAGREAEPIAFPEARFSQMITTRPPDPSLFILDTAGTAIYHFSLRLNLQRVLRPQSGGETALPNQPPTAFTITSGRVVMLAFGDKVYYAAIP